VNTLSTAASAVLSSTATSITDSTSALNNSSGTTSNASASNSCNGSYTGGGVSHLSIIPPLQMSAAFRQLQGAAVCSNSSSGGSGGSSGYEAFDASQVRAETRSCMQHMSY
jgi:hypothetical protein